MKLTPVSLSTAVGGLALLATTVATPAFAGADVRWSVTVGNGARGPVPVVVAAQAPVAVYPVTHPGRHPGYGDRDRDGIPNHADRRHNPPWDVDGDGIPNHRDRVYNPRWDVDGDGIPNHRDRAYNLPRPRMHAPGWRADHDHDGVPDRHDRRPHDPDRSGRR